MYDVFGKFGALRQVRLGNAPNTKGTAFVVYEDVLDAAKAVQGLAGYNLNGRYVVVTYHNASKLAQRADLTQKREELARMREAQGL